jgi:hypothetical protein
MRLAAFERRWASEVARTFVAPGALGGAVDDVDAGALFAEDCASSPWVSVAPIRFALWLVWFWPLFRRGRTFGALPLDGREVVLERMLDSRVALVRMVATFLKLICVSLVLGDRRALAAIGAYGMRP